MPFHFKKHYSRAEARALLPRIRIWLEELARLQADLSEQDGAVKHLLARGDDLGGDLVNRSFRTALRMNDILQEFESREIQVKDIDRGLIDFPAIRAGREVFLCWEKDEEDITFWHHLETGFAGRERL